MYDREFKRNEKIIGIKPAIQEFGPMLRGYESSNMSGKWQWEGLQIIGNNY
jgi:hypothetical protein